MYALFGAVVWGIHYNLISKAMTVASPMTVYAIPNVLLIASLPFWYKLLVADVQSILAAPGEIKAAVGAMMVTSILGSVVVYKAVHMSNATLASLIEITYPIFVAIFGIILFQQNHLSWPIVVGGLLIMTGTGVIIYFNG